MKRKERAKMGRKVVKKDKSKSAVEGPGKTIFPTLF
jgi:hypothetical protein